MKVKIDVPDMYFMGDHKIPFKFTLKQSKEVANFVLSAIRLRTQQGKQINGRLFARYSQGYKRYKQKHGRNSKVDLTFTGAMLGSMAIRRAQLVQEGGKFGGFKVEIGPSAAQMPNFKGTGTRPPNNYLAYLLHYGTTDMPPRPFLGVPKSGKVSKDVALIMREMLKVQWEKANKKRKVINN